ncbi:MAG TPA: Tex-like N-terminal domain-containing protein, partial [Candidatus Krumholzibacterium sp.]|nr:Tex-like N-terminal domain-containing protein [Candidatus Krumholzibacterium sp.]
MDFRTRIAAELKIADRQVGAVIDLLGDGATVPFIARYRKEATGSLDEVAISSIRDRLQQLEKLEKRREAILGSLEERGILTAELKQQIVKAPEMTALEDIYLPFRPKRKTRASVARERGLGPLADLLMKQEDGPAEDVEKAAAAFVDEEKGVGSVQEALEGARDIIAETVSEDAAAREAVRKLFRQKGTISSSLVRGKEEEGATYRDYFEWEEPCRSAPSHRILAMMRGEREKMLRLSVAPPVEEAERILLGMFVRGRSPASEQVSLAVKDGYRRLLSLSIASETRVELKRRADAEAIAVFAGNLRELLLAPPLGQRRVLAVDPGFRTGCKLAVLDELGSLVHHDTIYPHTGSGNAERAGETARQICEAYRIEAVAIGNGTAGRETEAFFRSLGLPGS